MRVDVVDDHLVVGVLLIPLVLVSVQEVVAQRDQNDVVRKQRSG
jgi:hypothetical protein